MLAVIAWALSPAGLGRDDAERIRSRLVSGWTIVLDRPRLTVAVRDDGRSHWQVWPLAGIDGIVIGQLFDRRATEQGLVAMAQPNPRADATLEQFAVDLIGSTWGRYLLVARDAHGSLTILRDPLGMCDCVTWCLGATRIVASQVPAELADLVPRAIDWRRVSSVIAMPATAGDALALACVETVPPGTLCQFGSSIRREVLWQPVDFCAPRAPCHPADPERLAAIVDACTAAWSEVYPTTVNELSGGLDSAIVAAARAAAARGRTSTCNFYTRAAAGDERCYARAVAAHLNMECLFIERLDSGLDRHELEAVATDVRPSVNAIDLHYDRAMADAASSASVDAIFTGQGGDAVFFQMPTALIAAERHVDDQVRLGRWTVLKRAARWNRTTLWATAWAAGPGRRTALIVAPPVPHFMRQAVQVPVHPWTATTAGVTPAKRLQIAGLANSCMYFGVSWRSRAADVIHPLLSQPLVEHVLAIPVLGLTDAIADRRLARRAFAHRLPSKVIDRHGKGDLTGYYGRMLANSPWLRDYLCSGVLAANGIVDAGVMAGLLRSEQLAIEDQYTEILTAAVVESWLRNWA